MEPIAVIGFSLRLPDDVSDEGSFWKVLQRRRNLMKEWPESRINVDVDGLGGFPTRGAHLLEEEEIAAFDAPFFSLTAAEAAAMDPQHRWALESSFHTLENAGIGVETLSGSQTAVFASTLSDDYGRGALVDGQSLPRTLMSGTYPCMLANRVSWYYNFVGPSVFVDTACSGSMVGLDLACKSIYGGDASMALVIGTSLLLRPEFFQAMGNMNFLSADGLSYSFDSRANGYGRGEGVLSLLIKPLSAAIASGDNIRALIRSTGSNQDGRTPGITMPSARAQETLIRHVYRKAALDLASTRYFEAHGTGTPTGDPIEMGAIGRVFGPHRSAENPLYVGSVKSNIGHLEGGSGLAGLVKTILLLERSRIAPVAMFKEINPAIDLQSSRLEIPTEELPWPCEGLRRASVNSFGFGGTNSHAIVDDACSYLHKHGLKAHHRCSIVSDEAPPLSNGLVNGHTNGHPVNGHSENGYTPNGDITNGHITNGHTTNGHTTNGHTTNHVNDEDEEDKDAGPSSPQPQLQPQLLVWSASSEKALQRVVDGYTQVYDTLLGDNPGKSLRQLSATLATRRSNLDWRTFAIVDSPQVVPGSEQSPLSKPTRASSATGLAFVFTGQGAQHVDMGMELLCYPTFEKTLLQMDRIFADLGCEWSLFDEITNPDHINLPEYAQPICTALQIGLVDLLAEFQVVPLAVVGHSSGEVAAAYAAGALSQRSAAAVAFHRGRLAGKLKATTSRPGAMVAVPMGETEVTDYLASVAAREGDPSLANLTVACVNSPQSCTISGPEGSVDSLVACLEKDGRRARKLATGVAYHSPDMQQIAVDYARCMGKLDNSKDATINTSTASTSALFFSSVTGSMLDKGRLSETRYWVDNLVNPVRFSEALLSLTQSSAQQAGWGGPGAITDVIEVGPHSALQSPIDEILSVSGLRPQPRYQPLLQRRKSALINTITLVGTLFSCGHRVSVQACNRQSDDRRETAPLQGCPAYPFDHSLTYWSESRLSRDNRRLKHEPYGILGRPFFDWNPLQPRWRNFLTTETYPWLSDHVTEDLITFPGAGSLVMAIKAAGRQVLPDRSVTGFFVKEASFLNPIIINEEKGKTESMVQLLPIRESSGEESSWFRVRIHAYNYHMDTWTECFDANIQVQYEQSGTEVDGGQEQAQGSERLLDGHRRTVDSCTSEIDAAKFYDHVEKSGIKYGKTFQLLDGLAWDGARDASATIGVTAASQYTTDDLFHPTTIDAAFQVSLASLSSGLSEIMPMWIPSRLSNTWVSAKAWNASSLAVSCTDTTTTEAETKGVQGMNTAHRTIRITTSDGDVPLCEIGEIVVTATTSTTSSREQSSSELIPVHGIEWRPQLSLMSKDQLLQACSVVATSADAPERGELYRLYNAAFALALRREIRFSDPAARPRLPEYFDKLTAAALPYLSDEHVDGFGYKEEDIETVLLRKCDERRPGWRLLPSVVRNLGPIFAGKVDPLEVFFADDGADAFYRDVFNPRLDAATKAVIDLASHEKPALRILEVGAGTGAMAERVLSGVREYEDRDGSAKLHSYTFTDISPSFFEKAKVKFEDFDDRMVFKVLDLEDDVESQGFDVGAYDIVIACSVLHATSELEGTLKNIRRLLKPGGHLLNLDAVRPDSFWINMMWGLLSGWWLSKEEYRARSPLVTESQWEAVLNQTGFQGIDAVVRDYEADAAHMWSLMISTAGSDVPTQQASSSSLSLPSSPPSDRFGRLAILVDDTVQQQVSLAEQILQHVQGFVVTVSEATGEGAAAWAAADLVVVSLIEVGRPFLATLAQADFTWLQHTVRQVDKLLWIASTSVDSLDGVGGPGPQVYALEGFFRTMRVEYPEKHIVTLVVEGNQDVTDAKAGSAHHVVQLLDAGFGDEASRSKEVEYIVRDGHITTARLTKEVAVRAQVEQLLSSASTTETWLPGAPVKLEVGSPGDLETLQLVEDRDASGQQPLAPHEVEVEARAWPVNFHDVLIALNKMDDGKEGLGLECAGVVNRLGSASASASASAAASTGGSDLVPGDRVVFMGVGTVRTYPKTHAKALCKIPEHMSFEHAASVINPAATAIHCLVNLARLRKGEKILIHSGAGSTGQMAIRIAQMIGAEVFTTVGLDEKKRFLMEKFDIPADHILYTRNTSFAKGIKRLTDGYGVDVVLNSLSGDSLQASWECVAPFGRFVEIGRKDIRNNSKLSMRMFKDNLSFFAMDLVHILQSNVDLMQQLMASVFDFLSRGVIETPQPVSIYNIADVESAYRHVQSGKHAGRAVLSVAPSDVVVKRLYDPNPYRFPPDASYVIAGGLGGVGRAIASWMVDMGARNLILLSRSGAASSPAATRLVSQLSSQGVNVATPLCDTAVESELKTVLEECQQTMPPVQGCINAAMVLRNKNFEQMSHAEWNSAIQPKVAASWNLHSLLPRDLDFFLMLSSVAGIQGSAAQSNYATGCTYQDALSRYRLERGQNSTSIDLGWMRAVGAVAESSTMARVVESGGSWAPIELEELLAVLRVCCRPSRGVGSPSKSQLVLGVWTAMDLVAMGRNPTPPLLKPMFSSFATAVGKAAQGGGQGQGGSGATKDEEDDAKVLLQRASSAGERLDIIVQELVGKLTRSLALSPGDIDEAKCLSDYGIDSLVAVEMRNWINHNLHATIPVFELLSNLSIGGIANLIMERTALLSVE